MDGMVRIRVDGRTVAVPADTMLASALLNLGMASFRRSLAGEARGPVCGMGICYECRVSIDGEPHRRSCMEPVREGMDVVTGG
jgi:D-hydroxyproline dehydrogenase subunit gamma